MKKTFIERVNKVAQEGYREYGILPSLTLAQAILESDWGRRHIGNNIFGIKRGTGWTGEVRKVKTHEHYQGERKPVYDYFRVYDSLEDSIRDYLKLIGRAKRYEAVRRAKTYKEASINVLRAGYATDPNYSKKLIYLIEEHKLYLYDQPEKTLHSWGRQAWKWGMDEGLTDGSQPQSYASREEVMTFLYRLNKKK